MQWSFKFYWLKKVLSLLYTKHIYLAQSGDPWLFLPGIKKPPTDTSQHLIDVTSGLCRLTFTNDVKWQYIRFELDTYSRWMDRYDSQEAAVYVWDCGFLILVGNSRTNLKIVSLQMLDDGRNHTKLLIFLKKYKQYMLCNQQQGWAGLSQVKCPCWVI